MFLALWPSRRVVVFRRVMVFRRVVVLRWVVPSVGSGRVSVLFFCRPACALPPAPAFFCCHGCVLLMTRVENKLTYSIWEGGVRMSTIFTNLFVLKSP